MKNLYFFVFLTILFPFPGFSQFTFFNNGAQVFVKSNAVMHVNGNATNSGNSGLFQNDGGLTVKNSNLQGDFIITNGGTVQGNGDFKVEGDWENNSLFIGNSSNQSHVELSRSDGVKQFIKGTQVTTFYDLELSGSGIKEQDTNVFVSNTLNLNDRELATDVHTMFVSNPSPAAISNSQTFGSEGFVSSKAPGVLSRVTNSTSSYLFPTGSSEIVSRYRPVEVVPNQANNNTYTARFINNNCDNDGFIRTSVDTVVCTANDTFYHAILRSSGTDSADIKLYFIPVNDGNWLNMAHWRDNTAFSNPNMWNDMKTTNLVANGNFTVMTRPSWKFANPGDPYLLTEAKPAPPTVFGTQTFCAWDSGAVFTAISNSGNPGSTFAWTVSPTGEIVSGQGTDLINVSWDTISGPHYISVTEITISGCSTNGSAPYNLTIFPLPKAGYDTFPGGFFGEVINFVDTSIHANAWQWSFGDGDSSGIEKPTHNYSDTGTFEVMLIVTSANGCKDTVYGEVHIGEGINIPNVFTPNNDGVNDYFFIPSMGIKEFHIKIYNRWGNFIWETSAPKIEWDGRNYSGELIPDGTYYYLLTAILGSGDNRSTTGHITLIR